MNNSGELDCSGTRRNKPETICVDRIGPILQPDSTRVLLRPFRSGNRKTILKKAAAFVMALSDKDVEEELAAVLREFGSRHPDPVSFARNRFMQVDKPPGINAALSPSRKALIGSYFCHEYSVEAAALFNPSIVRHPDQRGLPEGSLRFIMSLRATGEGHISSVEFRTGVMTAGHRITIAAPAKPLMEPIRSLDAPIEKAVFIRKLHGLGLRNEQSGGIMDQVPETFLYQDIQQRLENSRQKESLRKPILRILDADREVSFDPETELSQRVLFPFSADQRNGIEDARFVEFRSDEDTITFYATYTAFDGKHIRPKLLSTEDFRTFTFMTLVGPGVRNKGMALFPRKIGGRFVMLSRQDDRSIQIMISDNVQFWGSSRVIMEPRYTWEMLKIGICSSPIETEFGWLVLSHGVGPMRKYCIGAFLLDIDNPTRLLGRLSEPLMVSGESERDGYVPNVLYTCGALVHDGELIIPYASSDSSTRFAVVKVHDVLGSMT